MGGATRSVLVLSVLFCWISAGLSETCDMLPSADDSFSVQFETGRNGNIKSLDKIEVSAYFNNIVDRACAEDLTLTMQQPDGTWGEVEAEKQTKKDRKRREKYFLWKVSPVVPCRVNKFRLMSGENFVEAEFSPASLADMEDLEYRPGTPQNIKYLDDELKWDAIECATSYTVDIFDYNGEEVLKETVNENTIRLDDLEYCEEFEYTIFPFVGEFESADDEGNGEFTKQPNIDALYDLEVDVEAAKESAAISWEMSKDISCIDKYRVEVCEVKDDTECQEGIVYNPVDESVFNLDISGLKKAHAYQVVLTAYYRGNEFYRQIKKEFETLLDLEEFKVEAVADYETVTIAWDDVAIANSYIVYRQYEDEEWSRIADVTDDLTFQSEEEPCMDITYAVTVVTSDNNYDKKESNTVNLQLDESLPFLPDYQNVEATHEGATLTWTHLACIHEYEVNICDELMLECSTTTTPASEIIHDDEIIYDIEDLTPCTTYIVEVFPQIAGNSWQGDPLVLEITTDMSLTPPPQDSIQVETWTPQTPVSITWENTSCAESYELFIEDRTDADIYFYKTVDSQSVVFENEDVNPCTEYEFQIVATAGENRSEDASIGHFFVGPEKSSLQEIHPNVIVGIFSIEITIPMNRGTKCIEQYEISVCTFDEECPILEVLEKNGDGFTFSYEDLLPATDYTIHLIPLYDGEKLQTLDEAFTQDISTLMDLEGISLEANLEPEQTNIVQLEWQEVKGADEYEIRQQYGADQERALVLTTGELSAAIEQSLCSTATYSLLAKRRGGAAEQTIYSSEVTAFLNDTEPYMAANLNIDMEDNRTTITWDHLGPCIASYSVLFNNKQGQNIEQEESPGAGDPQVSATTDRLENCKLYKLEIVPTFTNGEEWQAEPEVQQEMTRLDDKKCVVPKVVRHASAKHQIASSASRLSLTVMGPMMVLMILLLSLVILRDLSTDWLQVTV